MLRSGTEQLRRHPKLHVGRSIEIEGCLTGIYDINYVIGKGITTIGVTQFKIKHMWIIFIFLLITQYFLLFSQQLVAGGKMKGTGPDDWQTPNEGATNESGFSGKGAGVRFPEEFPDIFK